MTRPDNSNGADMWKALLPGGIVLVTLGLSLVSGHTVKREAEPAHRERVALARMTEPAQGQSIALSRNENPDGRQLAKDGRPVALIIGNAAYPDVGLPLVQPVNNARALAETLKEKGFDVALGENLTKQEMERAFEDFRSRVKPGAATLIFFSGFGIQAGRQTYLVPVNAQIWSEDDVRRSGVTVE